ncbi:MAG: dihydrolipoamide dehydrogenase [Pseudomonadota bacterium]|nr:dihydrolipoamide dehydrogenase [Pseudomonadota bacterium]MDQ1344736.1 dihydrolipoamide dehydrogenase [Pseudomonadota bacterium]
MTAPSDSSPSAATLRVPELGDVQDVAVIDVLVKPGDRIEVDTPLVTLESDKATMEVPATAAGVVMQVHLKTGDKVSSGTAIATLASPGTATEETATHGALRAAEPYGGEPYLDTVPIKPMAHDEPVQPAPGAAGVVPEPARGSAVAPTAATRHSFEFDLVVLGAGPGGYTAAFRAADLGLAVALIERGPTLGGVCLNVGCIPSKALLHAARVIEDAEAMAEFGVRFGAPEIDAAKLRDWKDGVVARLTGGLETLARQRKVTVIRGEANFVAAHELQVGEGGTTRPVSFDQCIIAAGSESMRLPGLPDDPRIIDSTGALELDLPESLLVVGGGIIGLEMATVYDALGVAVSVVELTPGLMPGCDRDLVRVLEKRVTRRYTRVLTGTRMAGIEATAEGLRVAFAGDAAPEPQLFGKVLVAVGRSPNGRRVGAAAAGVHVDERGFIPVDRQMRTNVPHIFAIGDVVGQPMLAHKATHEGKVAAEAAAGLKSFFDATVIPSVAYTDPEVAWVGLTETEAKARGVPFEKAAFPWSASGRSLALGRDEGFTKLLFDPQTHRVLGGGIVGTNAGDLIAEVALAIEMGADAADLALTIHPHPTLSETVAFAAEAFEGTLTDLYLPRRKPPRDA